MDLRLATQTVRQDFGSTMLQLPSIPCSPLLNVCNMVPIPDKRVVVSCDPQRLECVGDFRFALLYYLDLSKDPAFQSGIGQTTADSVRRITLSYGLRNTLTFNIPEVDVKLGPRDVTSAQDPRLLPLGQIGPFKAGMDVPDGEQELVIEDGTPAHAFLVERIAHPELPFGFVLSSVVPFRGGDAFPAGQLELRITPVLRLLKR